MVRLPWQRRGRRGIFIWRPTCPLPGTDSAMHDRQHRCSRRNFLASAAALTLAGGVGAQGKDLPRHASTEGRKPIALLTTVYRPLSHSYHIGGRFIHGYLRGSKVHYPKHYVHSFYVDQKPDNDVSEELAKEFHI